MLPPATTGAERSSLNPEEYTSGPSRDEPARSTRRLKYEAESGVVYPPVDPTASTRRTANVTHIATAAAWPRTNPSTNAHDHEPGESHESSVIVPPPSTQIARMSRERIPPPSRVVGPTARWSASLAIVRRIPGRTL
jgi:hypothetical protein